MTQHALLSPSSAHRWLNCTAAPRLEATLPASTSVYAEEGTLAHKVCEITAKKSFGLISQSEFTNELKVLKQHELWQSEMIGTAETYTEHLRAQAMQFKSNPCISFELEVSLSNYAPESFGRCDCVMFAENTMIVCDYKHGKGVHVEVANNPQLMLYALGALDHYRVLFGDEIRTVRLCIDQPRIDSYETWDIPTEALYAWGESIRPIAQKAFNGTGEFHVGDWCRFCRANGTCRAQSEMMLAANESFADIGTLNAEQISEALKRGAGLVEWYEQLKAKAQELILSGESIEGYKVVEGRSARTWTDQKAAFSKLNASGIDNTLLYDSVPKSLAKLEKALGAQTFNELVGEFVTKPEGKPTLVEASDKRPDYNTAARDFADVALQTGFGG